MPRCTEVYVETLKRGKTTENRTSLCIVDVQHRMLQHFFECISHARLLASAVTHIAMASHSLCPSALTSHSHTPLLFYFYIFLFCPKCIYSYTLYGLFTNVASATYHYYYCYNNNSRTIKQSTHCFRLFDYRLSEQSDLPRLRLSALLGPISRLLVVIDCQLLLDSRLLLPVEGHIPNKYLKEHTKIVQLFEVDVTEAITLYVMHPEEVFDEPDQEAIRQLRQAHESLEQ